MFEYEILISVVIAVAIASFFFYLTGRDIKHSSDRTITETVKSVFLTPVSTSPNKETLTSAIVHISKMVDALLQITNVANDIHKTSKMADALLQITNVANDIHKTTVEILKEVKK